MYHPKLRLDSATLPERPATDLGSQLTAELQASNRFSEDCRIEVSVAGRTAILRGEVTSASERDLAELVVGFEPGISNVKNELAVAKSPASPQPAPAAPDSR